MKIVYYFMMNKIKLLNFTTIGIKQLNFIGMSINFFYFFRNKKDSLDV